MNSCTSKPWREEDGNYIQHFRVREGLSGLGVIEIIFELRDGRVYRLGPNNARRFVQFSLKNPDLEAQAARLQELSLPPDLYSTSTDLFNCMRQIVRETPEGIV